MPIAPTNGIPMPAVAFGVVPDGVTDNTVALQNAIDAAIANRSNLMLPGGTIVWSDTLVLDNITGFTMYGPGGGAASLYAGTQLQWNGNGTAEGIRLHGTQDVTLRDFAIKTSAAKPLAYGIRQYKIATSTVAPRRTRLVNLGMDGTNGGIIRCVVFDDPNTLGDNDNHQILGSLFTNHVMGVLINGTQCKGIRIKDCDIRGYGLVAGGGSRCAVGCGYDFVAGADVYTNGGSFSMHGGFVSSSMRADFVWGGVTTDPTVITNVHSEGSVRSVWQNGGATSEQPLTLIGNRFADNGALGNFASYGAEARDFTSPSDGAYVIATNTNGPVVIIGGIYTLTTARLARLRMTNSSGKLQLTILGTKFDTTAADFEAFIHRNGNGQMDHFVQGVTLLNAGTRTYVPSITPRNKSKAVTDANYTATDSENNCLVRMTALTAGRTFTLPTAVNREGYRVGVFNTTNAQTVTIATTSAQTINGVAASTFNLTTQFAFAWFESDGANYVKVG